MGWLGFPLIGVGAILVWAGVQGVSALDAVRAVLNGEPIPKRATSSTGAAPATGGGSNTTGGANGNAGDGVAGGGSSGGGGW